MSTITNTTSVENTVDSAARVFVIPERNVARLEQHIAKYQRKAEKLSLGGLTLTRGAHIDREEYVDQSELRVSNGKMIIRYYEYTISGEMPVINGWSLVAVIDHTGGELGNIIRAVPNSGLTCPVEYRSALASDCDHCGMTRKRNDTFVLYNVEASTYKRVGRNCLADFIRDPKFAECILSYYEYYEMLVRALGECEETLSGAYADRYYIMNILMDAQFIINTIGWTSASAARNAYEENDKHITTTREYVQFLMSKPDGRESNKERQLRADHHAAMRDDALIAKWTEEINAAIAWIQSHDKDSEDTSDYIYNLMVLTNETSVRSKDIGLLVSLVPAYRRHLDKMAGVERAKKVSAESNHVGSVKDKISVNVKVIGKQYFDGQYGTKTLLRMMDESGNIYIWWASKYIGDDELPEDKEALVSLKGTIKAHNTFKGCKQNEMTRCKLS